MTELANQSIVLEVEGFAPNTLVVTQLSGREGLSELWEFDLQLVSRDTALDLEQVLYAPVRLGLKQGILAGGEKALRTRWFSGVFAEFRQKEAGQGWVSYTARLVPKLWLSTQFWRSRIVLDENVQGLVSAVLSGGAQLSEGQDFSFSLNRAEGTGKEAKVYPEREYVVQYEETDFDFVSRWLEHEGVFYYFTNDGEEETVQFADSTAAYKDSRVELPYRPSSAAGSDQGGENTLYDDEVLRTFECQAGRLPKQVRLKDYNWRTPEVQLSVSESVKDDGVGLQTEYNDHYKTEDQGKALASVRRQELACRSVTYRANSNCKALRPGSTFQVKDHYRADFNTNYLVVGVRHEAEQSVDLDGGTAASGSYSNSLELIPAEASYRPERHTEWPSIKGVMHAKVDAPETDGELAEIDDYGRYRITFPFDEAIDKDNDDKRTSGPASRYVRQIQPYAGRESGMHFPLLKGTEVLVTHLDGDPDRPVIVGAVPNPDTMSPVTSANYTSNKIVTTAGHTMLFDDDPSRPTTVQFDAGRTTVEVVRCQKGGGGGSAASPGGGSGGVQPKRGAAAQRTRKAAQPASQPARRSTPPASQPGAGVGAVTPAVTLPTPPPPPDTSYFDDFVANLPSGAGISKSDITDKLDSVLRKYDDAIAGSMPSSMGELQSNALSEPYGIPSGGGHADLLDSLPDQTSHESYTYADTKLNVKIGNNIWVKLGTLNFTFDDVSNSVSIGTGGYSYSLTKGDSFSETYNQGASVSVSRFFGTKDSFDLHMAASNATTWSLDASESQTMKLGASNSMELYLSAESEFKLGASMKQSTHIWCGLSSEIDIYAAAKFSLELGAVAALNIKIVPDDCTINLPKKTEITVQDLKVMVDNTNAKLNTTTAAMAQNHVALNKTQAALNKVENELAETKNTLSSTENELSSTKTALNETQTRLNKTRTALAQSHKCLSNDIKTLAFTSNSAFTSL